MGKGQNSVKKSEMPPKFFGRHPGGGFSNEIPRKIRNCDRQNDVIGSERNSPLPDKLEFSAFSFSSEQCYIYLIAYI